MTRKEAAAKNLTKYNNGKSCIHGHEALRYTVSGQCVGCCIDRQRQTNHAMKLRKHGITLIRVTCDPRDEQQIRQFAEALRVAHQIEEGVKW